MMEFETYRWEDHVPRAGSWRFNLAAGALAFGLIAAAFPEAGDHRAAALAPKPSTTLTQTVSGHARRDVPVALIKAAVAPTHCHSAQADS